MSACRRGRGGGALGRHLCQLGLILLWQGVGREHDASPIVRHLFHLHSLFASQVDAILRLNAAFIQKYGLDPPESECCCLGLSMCCHFGFLAEKINPYVSRHISCCSAFEFLSNQSNTHVIYLFDKQPPKVQQKSKEQKMAAAMAGGKGKKKKWSKGKSRDKVDNKVLFSKEQYDRLNSEVPKMKLITVSTVVEKLKISGGLARRALMQLAEEGSIRPVCVSRAQRIYTRNIGEDEEE